MEWKVRAKTFSQIFNHRLNCLIIYFAAFSGFTHIRATCFNRKLTAEKYFM